MMRAILFSRSIGRELLVLPRGTSGLSPVSPAREALPDGDGTTFAEDLILGKLRGRGARVVRQHAQARADREAREIDRPAVSAGDDPVLLVRFDHGEIVDRPPGRIAGDAV